MVTAKRLISRLFFVGLMALGASGCGVFGQCNNKCPAGFKHDVFCGCYKPEETKTGGGTQSRVPSALSPEWVCPVSGSSTQFESWEPDKGFGLDMNGLIGKTVPFASRACDTRAIPFLLQAASCQLDSGGDPLCTTPGTRSVMTVSTVTRRTNLINGGVAWGVRGTITDRSALNEPASSDPPPSLAGGLLSQNVLLSVNALRGSLTSQLSDARDTLRESLPSVSFGVANAAAPQSCEIHCRQQDEFCAVATIDRVDLARWQQLLKRVSSKSSVVSKREIMDAAAAKQDPCARGDLAISTNGQFSNTGDSCRMDIPFDGGTASVSLPARIAGQLSLTAASSVDVAFATAAESPAVDFSDKEVHEEFGGLITRMELSSRAMTVATSSGKCIQLRR